MTRVAVVDLGSNSSRLLIADVAPDGAVTELDRRSTVTRLGHGVDATGVLDPDAIERVHAALTTYRAVIDAHAPVDVTTGVLTSAVRDARDGPEFAAGIRTRFGIDAHTIGGDEEARLTYLGATSERAPSNDATLVIDIGGGSTELVVGRGSEMLSHVSTQVGVVRHTERHLRGDPPTRTELDALRKEVSQTFAPHARDDVTAAIAVAGTATSCAAMLLELDPYDPEKVEGLVLDRDDLDALLRRTATMTVEQRRAIPGLHPDRAPTIVAGIAILLEVLSTFGLRATEVSEHDILRGVVLSRSGIR